MVPEEKQPKSYLKLTIQTPETQTEENDAKHLQRFQSTNMKRQTLQNCFSDKMTDDLM